MCETCDIARASNGAWRYFDSRKCQWCAARLIQRIPPNEPERRRVILRESVASGLSEGEIRALVKGPAAYAPVTGRRGK